MVPNHDVNIRKTFEYIKPAKLNKMYTLRIPFRIPDGYQITDVNKLIRHEDLEFKLKKEGNAYVLIASGFSTKNSALDHLSLSWPGFMWVLINCGIAIRREFEPQEIRFAKDPVAEAQKLSKFFGEEILGEVHGVIDGARPVVFESNRRFKCIFGDDITFTSGPSAERFLQYYLAGIQFNNYKTQLENSKLNIALELYGAFFSESTQNARFLTLVMVLESLCEVEKKPQIALDLIKTFGNQIDEAKQRYSNESEESRSLDCLKKELDILRRKDSIRQRIRSLVFEVLSKNGDEDAADVARQAVKIYDKRSTLIHNGSLPPAELSEISQKARNVVDRVLKAKFVQIIDEC